MAGGYNVQRLHYRYITKTNVPASLKQHPKLISLKANIKRLKNEIKKYEQYILIQKRIISLDLELQEARQRRAELLRVFSEQSQDLQDTIMDTVESRAIEYVRGFLVKNRKQGDMVGYIVKCESIFAEVMRENGIIG